MLIESLRLDGSTVHCRRAAVKAAGERVAGSGAHRSAVAMFLAAFSAFYCTISVPANREYRDEFVEEVVGEVRQAFAVRAVYLGAIARLEAETHERRRGGQAEAGA